MNKKVAVRNTNSSMENSKLSISFEKEYRTKKIGIVNYPSIRHTNPSVNFFPIISIKNFLSKHSILEKKDSAPCYSFSVPKIENGEYLTRANKNIEKVHALVFDIDSENIDPKELSKEWGRYCHIIHSTYSHTKENGKYRFVLFIESPLIPEDYKKIWPYIIEKIPGADLSCKDVSRAYYFPSCPEKNYSNRYFHFNEGEFYRISVERTTAFIKKKVNYRKQGNVQKVDLKTLDMVGLFKSKGKYNKQTEESGKHWVNCPWADEHKSKTKIQDAFIREPQDGKGALFHCSHNGCWKNKKKDVMDILALWPDSNKFCTIRSKVSENPIFTEAWAAKLFVEKFGDKFLFDHTSGKWLTWDGKRWAVDTLNSVVEYGKKSASEILDIVRKKFGQNHEDYRKAIRFAIKMENKKPIFDFIKLASSSPSIAIEYSNLDSNHNLINLNSGTLNLKTLKHCLHVKEDFLTKVISIKYDQNAECPIWVQFLEKVFQKNKEVISFIQRAVGYSFTGSQSEQCMFFLYGNGKNGKSTFLKVMEMLFGDYFKKIPISTIMPDKFGNKIRNDVAMLPNVRFASVSEFPEGEYMDEAMLKDLTGGDTITARKLHQEFFSFVPTQALWATGNHKPLIKGRDEGIWRRLVLIPFNYEIEDKEERKMSDLLREFKMELPGILNWALEGLRKYQELNGLQVPTVLRNEIKIFRDQSGIVEEFIEHRCEENVNVKVSVKDLYKEYLKYAIDSGALPLSKRKFCDRIRDLGFSSRNGAQNVVFWMGLQLNQSLNNEKNTSSSQDSEEA